MQGQTSIGDPAEIGTPSMVASKRASFAGGRAAWMALCACVVALFAPASRAEDAQKADGKLPEFSVVVKNVESHFAANANYRHGDIISRRDVTALFEALEELGWEVADRKAIEERVPLDGEFLVTQLRTRAGRKFMAQIAAMPQGYDRVDRLSALSDGKQIVQELITGPDGYKMFEYMTSSEGGREIGRMLSRTAKRKNFNEPTGRIYTAAQLIARLKESYASAQEPEKPARSRAASR
ncbi:MAG: hypothetical protein WD847_00780 [Pirellulales bacterium]